MAQHDPHTVPLIVTVTHRRSVDTVLGEQAANIVYGGYVDNVVNAGGTLVALLPGAPIPGALIKRMDGVLLTGGGDVDPAEFGSDAEARDIDAARDAMELELVRACRERRIPLLGMCRGNQVMTVALGGTLTNVDGHVQREPLSKPVHTVALERGCRLARAIGDATVAVNTFHRWAVGTPADGFKVTGAADDGVPEAIEYAGDDWYAVGTQWHAELLDTPHVAALFSSFVEAARTGNAR